MLQRKCACGGSGGLTGSCSSCEKKKLLGQSLQTKLRINEPGDVYEQEADRVAAQVMRMTDAASSPSYPATTAMVQRRLALGELASGGAAMLQRQEGSGADAPAQSEEAPAQQQEESRCPSWRNDPESISKRAAETYVQNDMNPPSQATVEKIKCEPPIANGNYGCYVHFSDGLVIRVIVRATDIVVGTGPGPFTTLTPPPGTPLCFYDYHCPDNFLVLTKRECKSAKPSSSGPTLVGQRRAGPGAAGAMDASSTVNRVLTNSGQPLDGAAQEFFSARLGHDFANVRVHADAEAAALARAVNALAYTVGRDVVFAAGQYAPNTRAGQELLAHELTHVVQQSAAPRRLANSVSDTTPLRAAPATLQRQPTTDGPTLRDLPIFLEKLEFDVGQNLLDYGHHLYRAALRPPSDPDALKAALGRYALGANVLKDTYGFFGFKSEAASRLAIGTGILFKGLTLARQGELTLDFQFDIGKGIKFETNLNIAVDPKNLTDVRKGEVNFGLVRRF